MLRKFSVTLLLAVLGLLAISRVASAAPPYPPGPVGVLGVSSSTLDGPGPVDVTGSGMDPFEIVDVTITYSGPIGLRANKALLLANSTVVATSVKADATGHFSATVNLTQNGTATITATGRTSGRSQSIVVRVGPVSPGTTTVEPPTGSVTAIPAAVGGSGGTGGLASTGVSIAGPLTVGASALIVGLGLLFFGTRLVIRRKHSPSAH